jgi:hypothetical protein
MLYNEIIDVCSEIHTKHINTLCGQNVEFVNVKHGGPRSNHWALKGNGVFWMLITKYTFIKNQGNNNGHFIQTGTCVSECNSNLSS